jgi:hypothetical protein
VRKNFALFSAAAAHRAKRTLKATRISEIREWLIAVLLLLTCFFAGMSAIYLKKQVADQRNIAEQQLRAYVGITDVEMTDPDKNRVLRWSFSLKNYSQTPAFITDSAFDIDTGDPRKVHAKHGTIKYLGPNQILTIAATTYPLSAAVISTFLNPKNRFFVRVVCSYRDIFHHSHQIVSLGHYRPHQGISIDSVSAN